MKALFLDQGILLDILVILFIVLFPLTPPGMAFMRMLKRFFLNRIHRLHEYRLYTDICQKEPLLLRLIHDRERYRALGNSTMDTFLISCFSYVIVLLVAIIIFLFDPILSGWHVIPLIAMKCLSLVLLFSFFASLYCLAKTLAIDSMQSCIEEKEDV